jgi:Tfp pilus assembly protein PilZ
LALTKSKQQSNEFSVIARLTDAINTLSEAEQRKLLSIVDDWLHGRRRKHTRKPCAAAVDYAVQDRVFKDFALNISAGGVFIETNRPLSVGQEISLTFSPPNPQEPVKITGKVVRNDSQGIAVKFEAANDRLIAMMQDV